MMDSFSYVGEYINSWYNPKSLDDEFISYNFWNFLKFDDSKSTIKNHEKD